MRLTSAKQWLDRIKRRYPGLALRGVRVTHNAYQDRRNREDPRAFCHVACGDKVIHCAAAIEQLDDREIVGLLLHEVGHIVLGCGRDPDDEVAVDEWVRNLAPESGYTYLDVRYMSRIGGPVRTAVNLESVSHAFVNQLRKA